MELRSLLGEKDLVIFLYSFCIALRCDWVYHNDEMTS